ncbi:uncharacterized protein LOC125955749 [Anopheles darlingi]|uniref:uncharacterized protein LOC125955749 n=1 Tax=Anopheles darlingi TaxID=43151 RepID=UPI0001E9591D|nr:uncharacterized protein LOC125955749 [Anopheles darlingi]
MNPVIELSNVSWMPPAPSTHERARSLEKIIFRYGAPKPGELVEISGASNTGKSLLLLELIAHIILPTNCGGTGQEVVLIDCENSYDSSLMLDVMEKGIQKDAEPEVAATLDVQQLKRIQEEALQRLHRFACHTLEIYDFCLRALKYRLFIRHPSIRYVLVDSIASFYWTTTKCYKKRALLMERCETLRRMAQLYKRVIVYTKPSSFGLAEFKKTIQPQPTSAEDRITQTFATTTQHITGGKTPGIIDVAYRIELSAIDPPPGAENDIVGNPQWFNASITARGKNQFRQYYLIYDLGFDWISEVE